MKHRKRKLKPAPGRMSGKRAREIAIDYLATAKLEKQMGQRQAAAQSLKDARRLLSYSRSYQ